jgi:hypothetical protein
MLVRVVQLRIRPEEVPLFCRLFEDHCQAIRANPGCLALELLQEEGSPGSLATLSRWQSEDALNHYRNSTFFRTLWSQVKPLFSAPAQAFSYSLLSTAE